MSIHGIVFNELKAPAANVTVHLVPPSSGQEITHTTNASGRFQAELPPGEYRIQAYHPNETGELWHDGTVQIVGATGFANPLSINRTQPFVPRTPSFSPSNNPGRIGNSTARDVDAIVRVPIQYAGPGANKTVRAEVDLQHPNGTSLGSFLLGNATLQAGRPAWLNATLGPGSGEAYHAREQRLLLRLRLYDNETGALLDRVERVELVVQDECAGDAIAVQVRLAAKTHTICADATEAPGWQDWQALARQLQSVDAQWAARATTDRTTWTGDDALDFWQQYEAGTSAMRAPILARLDAAQTDRVGRPTWQELQTLRADLESDRNAIRAAAATSLRSHVHDLERQEDRQRLLSAATVVATSLLFAGLGVLAAVVIVRNWRRQTEYWIGYSAKSQARDPFLWLALGATVCFLVGVTVAALVGGPRWFLAIAGGG